MSKIIQKKTKHGDLLFSSEGIFCSRNDLTCQPLSVCGAVVFRGGTRAYPRGWQQTVYFVCTAKRLRLGSPFLFSQWKGEIDGYHLRGIALFERYQTFHRHHWILSWANKHTYTHSHRVFHFVRNFLFAVGRREGRGWDVFSFAHLRHSCWFMCNLVHTRWTNDCRALIGHN